MVLAALCISTLVDDEEDLDGCLFAFFFFATTIRFLIDLYRGITLGISDKKSKTRPFVIILAFGIAMLASGLALRSVA